MNLRADPLVRRMATHIRREGWLPRGAGVLAMVSGGGDSTALALILHALAEEFEWRLAIFHAHHGRRGEAADRAAQMVRDLAGKLDLPVTVSEIQLAPRAGEAAMREARFEAARAVARERGLGALALGHTRDDLAETVIHRAVRGSGLTGLASMRPVSDQRGLRLVRPLLGETRQGLRLFLRDLDAAWDEDETNAHLSATRNRIRHTVLPLLRAEINPQADEALARLADHAAQDDAQLDADTDEALAKQGIALAETETLPLVWLRALPPALLRRVLRRWLMALADSPLPPSSRHVEGMIDRIRAEEASSRWTAAHALTFGLRDGALRVQFPPRIEVRRWPQFHGEPQPIPEEDEIPLGRGWTLRSRRVSSERETLDLRHIERWSACVDANRLEGPIVVRRRRQGDVFEPLGFPHRKPLRRFMTDLHLPRSIRAHLPLVCDAERIIWVVGCRIADSVKVTEDTREILELRVHPPSP